MRMIVVVNDHVEYGRQSLWCTQLHAKPRHFPCQETTGVVTEAKPIMMLIAVAEFLANQIPFLLVGLLRYNVKMIY